MNKRKVKIISIKLEKKNDLVKMKVQDVESSKDITWAMTSSDFDAFVGQLTKKNLSYNWDQRKTISDHLINICFLNEGHPEISNLNATTKKTKEEKENTINEISQVMDKYPFSEIAKSINEDDVNEN